MPKIFEYLGLVFFFYSNDHEPVHVHVLYGEFESKIEFEISNGKVTDFALKKIRGKEAIPESKLDDVKVFVDKYGQEIVNKWIDFYVLKKKLKNEKITKKIK
jgi:hypothetical protein